MMFSLDDKIKALDSRIEEFRFRANRMSETFPGAAMHSTPKPADRQTAAVSGSRTRDLGISTLPYTGDAAIRRQRDSESATAHDQKFDFQIVVILLM